MISAAYTAPWHKQSYDRFIQERLPELIASRLPLASYHVKSSTFGFADGHAEKHKWRDQRTLEFINVNAADPSSHSGIRTTSPDNEDLRWLIEHFMPQKMM